MKSGKERGITAVSTTIPTEQVDCVRGDGANAAPSNARPAAYSWMENLLNGEVV